MYLKFFCYVIMYYPTIIASIVVSPLLLLHAGWKTFVHWCKKETSNRSIVRDVIRTSPVLCVGGTDKCLPGML